MTLKLITGEHGRVASWVASKLAGGYGWMGNYSTLGVERNGELVGGMVVDRWVPGVRCTVSIAGTGCWLNKSVMYAAYGYLFNQLRCRVVLAEIDSSNTKSVRLTQHVGFKEVGRVSQGAEVGDLLIFSLARADCKWLKGADYAA